MLKLVFCIALCTNVLGQGSPEASKNSRSQDFPVNQYTGAVSVNIPIYTFTEGAITIPISLSYNTTGIRLRESASWCGLGWTLNAGGMVSRIVRGLPDEGSMEGTDFRKGFYQGGYDQNNDTDDHEPDLFVANINGQSFKFMFDNNKNIQVIPKTDVKILPYVVSSRADSRMNRFAGFKIITADGSCYFFGSEDGLTNKSNVYEYSITQPVNNGTLNRDNLSQDDKNKTLVNAWYLIKIATSNGQKVTFNYKYNYYAFGYMSSYEENSDRSLINNLSPFTTNFLATPVLYSIEGNNTKIEFFKQNYYSCNYLDYETGETVIAMCPGDDANSYTERKDLRNWDNYQNSKGKILKDIIVSSMEAGNWQNKLFYTFNYDYFTADNPWANINLDNTTEGYFRYRLKLNGIVFPDGSTTSFEYYAPTDGRSYPPAYANTEDHWGFYKGGNDLRSLVGTQAICQTNLTPEYNKASDKTTDALLSKTFSLQKITNSVGTETNFEYEVHDAWNYNYPIGGNRISKIITKDLISNVNIVKTYNYRQFANASVSSGFLIMEPVYRFSYPSGVPSEYGYNSGLYQQALFSLGRPIVSYKNVEEVVYSIRGDASSAVNDTYKLGSTKYTFNQNETAVVVCNGSEGYSYKPWTFKPSNDYTSGSMDKVEAFAKNGSRISTTQIEYFTNFESVISGYYIPRYNGQRKKDASTYSMNIAHFGVRKKTEIGYDYSGLNAVQNTTEYYYKNDAIIPQSYRTTYPGKHYQVVKIISKDSRDRQVEQWNKYAADYDFGTHQTTEYDCRYIYDSDARDWVAICDIPVTRDVQNVPTNADARAVYDLKQKNIIVAPIESFLRKNNKIINANYNTYYTGTGFLKDSYSLRYFPLNSFTEAAWSGNGSNLGASMTTDGNYILSNSITSYNQYGLPKTSKTNFGVKSEISFQMNELFPYQSTIGKDTPESQTSTTEYANSVFGVSKETKANGFSNSVTYDGIGRPIRVTDQNNNVLKQVEYKLKGQ
ncbi:hypothetical protein [Pseudarcicella hirudinis]|uniref:hypothetical protein n=1 Tax=Pseudarcicella hirudinis TaxID=1079859 RepID=UPI001160D5B2|nr:hypothetical protein [Pseudarcicella hirudinis]